VIWAAGETRREFGGEPDDTAAFYDEERVSDKPQVVDVV